MVKTANSFQAAIASGCAAGAMILGVPPMSSTPSSSRYDFADEAIGSTSMVGLQIDEEIILVDSSVLETAEILADKQLVSAIRDSERQIANGETVPWDVVKHKLGL
jgi:hypothetical protein